MHFGRHRTSSGTLLVIASLLLAIGLLVGCGGQTTTTTAAQDSGPQETTTSQTAETTIPEETVTISCISSFTKDQQEHAGFWIFVDKLEETSGGRVIIDYKGGPEVTPAAQQAQAVQSGMIDSATLPEAYYVNILPEAMTFKLSLLTPTEERANGLYELWNNAHNEQLNVEFIGRTQSNVPYRIFVNKQVQTLDDLKGLNIRSSATYVALLKALGCSPVSIAATEVHTALQRNVVDGFGWSGIGVHAFSWDEVVKFALAPEFYNSSTVFIINLQKWESLPDWAKQAIVEAMELAEKEFVDYYQRIYQEEQEAWKERGVQTIEFSAEDTQKFIDTANEAGWEEVLSIIPDSGALIKEIIDKN